MKTCSNCVYQDKISDYVSFSRSDMKRMFAGDAFVCRCPGLKGSKEYVFLGRVCWQCNGDYFEKRTDSL